MKKAILLTLTIFFFGIFATPAMAAMSTDDPVLWWDTDDDPETNETCIVIHPGGQISVDLYLSGVQTEDKVMGFTGHLYTGDLFVNSATQPGVTINTDYWDGSLAVNNYENGYIEFSGSVATAAPWVDGDNIRLATFTFDYNQEGEHLLNWQNEYEMFELNGFYVPPFDMDTYALKVCRVCVPVPGTMILLGTGLLGLLGIRRRA